MPLEVAELLAVDVERDLAVARDVPGKPGQRAVLPLAADRAAAGAAVVVEGLVVREEGGVAGEERVAPRAGRAEERDVERPGGKRHAGVNVATRGRRKHAIERVAPVPLRQGMRPVPGAGQHVQRRHIEPLEQAGRLRADVEHAARHEDERQRQVEPGRLHLLRAEHETLRQHVVGHPVGPASQREELVRGNEQAGGRAIPDFGGLVQHVNLHAGAAQVGREVGGEVLHEHVAVRADEDADMAHVRDQIRQVAVIVRLGRQGAHGVVEQREAAHQPGKVLGINPATTLERARLDEMCVRVNAGCRDVRVAAQVILAVEHLEALQPRDGRSERPPVDLAHHLLKALDLRLLGRCRHGGRGFRLVGRGRGRGGTGHGGRRPDPLGNPRADQLRAPARAPHAGPAHRLDERRLGVEFSPPRFQRRRVRLGLARQSGQLGPGIRPQRETLLIQRLPTRGLTLQQLGEPGLRLQPRRRLRLRLVAPAPDIARLHLGCEARVPLGCERLVGRPQPVAGFAELPRKVGHLAPQVGGLLPQVGGLLPQVGGFLAQVGGLLGQVGDLPLRMVDLRPGPGENVPRVRPGRSRAGGCCQRRQHRVATPVRLDHAVQIQGLLLRRVLPVAPRQAQQVAQQVVRMHQRQPAPAHLTAGRQRRRGRRARAGEQQRVLRIPPVNARIVPQLGP